MFTRFLITATAILSASAALAGGPVPGAAPVAAHDWTGPYAGLSLGHGLSDDWAQGDAGGVFDSGEIDSDGIFGGFLGYNLQRGNFVFGGELGWSRAELSPEAYPMSAFEDFLDVRGRVGYAMDRLMVYGTLGYMTSTYNDGDYDLDGITYGLGLQVATGNIVTGIEILRREMDGEHPLFPIFTDMDMTQIAVRAGLQF